MEGDNKKKLTTLASNETGVLLTDQSPNDTTVLKNEDVLNTMENKDLVELPFINMKTNKSSSEENQSTQLLEEPKRPQTMDDLDEFSEEAVLADKETVSFDFTYNVFY